MFLVVTFSLFAGCAQQSVYVYEKIPEFSECRQYTDYWAVSACNRKHQMQLSDQLTGVLRKSVHRLNRKYNQGDRCYYQTYRPVPTGCDISPIPRRGNIPAYGKTSN